MNLAEDDGQAVHTLSMSEAFAGLGNDVLLLVGGVSGSQQRSKVQIHTIRNKGWGARQDVRRAMMIFRPDLIYERRGTPKLGLSAASHTAAAYCLEVNGLADLEGKRRKVIIGWLQRIRLARLYGKCETVIVPARGLGEALERRYPVLRGRIVVVPNGVDLKLFKPQDKLQARSDLSLPLDTQIVAFVGKLTSWQGLNTLVDATSMLLRRRDFRVLIVGDGPQKAEIEAGIRESGLVAKVLLWGSVPHERVPVILAASDVCVAPFTRERNAAIEVSPMKIFEYMAAGRPIIASDVPGVKELVDDAALLVAPDSPAELATALETILTDPGTWNQRVRQGTLIAETCSWDSRARLLLRRLGTPTTNVVGG